MDISNIDCYKFRLLPRYFYMIDKTKTPILISTPRAGSHWVGQFLRVTYQNMGVILPGSSENFNTDNLPDHITFEQVIHYFEQTRNVLDMDICTITHAPHLSEVIRIPSRPRYETLFDWFKEFYDGYQIVLLRRRNVWNQYISWLFHKSIVIAQHQAGNTFTKRDFELHPWHNIEGTQREEILKSTMELLKPKFVHREQMFQKFLSDLRYMEEEVRNYYVNGPYNNLNVRDWWLEDLSNEKLKEWFYPEDIRDDYVMNEKITPFKLMAETYFKKDDLAKVRDRFMKVYNDELKHYGYLVD